MSFDFKLNLSKMEEIFKDFPNITTRKVTLNIEKAGCFFYIQGLIDTGLVQRDCVELVKYMQSIGSDTIGIGDMVRAKYNSYFNTVNWNEVYKHA